jgi:aminoglycoside 3-N-acetyltransferase
MDQFFSEFIEGMSIDETPRSKKNIRRDFMVEEIKGDLITVETLEADFISLGVSAEMTIILHSSMKSLGGWVVGGPVAVILALENILGNKGTLIMPTHSGDLSDPAEWENPPVKESWWDPIREFMPAYDPDLIPTRGMGIIPECFRKQKGVKRSSHPQVSFAAWGENTDEVILNHSIEYGLGENSPLSKVYDLNGWVLLLGVGNSKNTSIHLAEYRTEYATKKEMICKAPVFINEERIWIDFNDIDFDSSDFERLGDDFLRDTVCTRIGKVAQANAMLIPQREIIEYAMEWMKKNRN